ncbi:response regulator transcription factor [Dyadobacter frigoris]|uniref:Response regulator transcription factor n=1 Tax=Dyadobacter frigoris TaxID=2576211 RepID=A0A4U6CTL6_9BACT|nr:response regulator transcription factor [Dyadobacter frigoris]TKT88020.1 response regulator transcription factor [Dyadobacter frigoris]GLU52919.1 DNA-binding response regulator [Dyadobacter frigoris]
MKLLVIEDEESLLQSIVEYFTLEDFLCEGAGSFQQGIEKMEDFQYDCIILDINLPGGSGLDLLKYLRKNKKSEGVIIISARSSLDDKIAGLDLGADDYLTKPFHLSELFARVKSLIRRKYASGSDTLEINHMKVDLLLKTVEWAGKQVVLTKNEYDLLLFMLTNKNRVVSRQAIAEHIYGEETDNLASFDFVYSHIKNLKKKMKEKGCGDLIQTVYGLGYKLSI